MAKSFKETLTEKTALLMKKRLINGKDDEMKSIPFSNTVEIYHISDIRAEWQYSSYGYVGDLRVDSLQFKDCNETEFKLKDLSYIREFSDTNKSNIFYWVDWSECNPVITKVFFYDKKRTTLIEDEDNYMLKLLNGTVYSLNNLYWHDRASSKLVLDSIEQAILKRIAERFGKGGIYDVVDY